MQRRARTLRPTLVRFAVVLTVALGAGAFGQPSTAEASDAARVCSPRKITATGSSTRQPVVARRVAQAAWERKVRGGKALGPRFAAWNSARERSTVCRKLADRTRCLAAAIPCRSSRT
ncbi:MAG: hypothetical protein RL291_615 [Pseudomonadota bacterium]